MQNLTISLEEEEYDRTGDEEGSESDYSEGHVSLLHFYRTKSGKTILKKSSMSPPNLLHLFYKIMKRARVGFKCRSVLVNLREIYLILIEVPHLKHKLKATNLMSVFDSEIGNEDNQVILAMIERWWPNTHTFHLPYGKQGITPRDFIVLTSGIVVDWEVDQGEARTSQAGTSRRRGSRGRTYEGGADPPR
ncbi:hypothetical protein GIB67_007235 [Kingdonia uniflora]|uniref:Aminotransferase-like plant mobile domain-containing protein n=1 Tax=Kingdonia uniflora TaxID=39325 RepID=A0A7J7NXQ2_9MAGN|nr:hypothetical protein GIB67_007235 [Kingdonia uniflora]